MKVYTAFIFCFLSISIIAQDYEFEKFSIGARFIATVTLNSFSTKNITRHSKSHEYTSGDGDPVVGGGLFLDYHIDSHTAGLSYGITIYNFDYHSISEYDLVDDNGDLYSSHYSDYVDHYFHNFHANYKYSVQDDKTRMALVAGVGYHHVALKGYSNIYTYSNDFFDFSSIAEHSEETSTQYWSIKTGIEWNYFFVPKIGLYGYIGYDFGLGKNADYSFDYDQELVESGELDSITRSFDPPSIGEINFGIQFLL